VEAIPASRPSASDVTCIKEIDIAFRLIPSSSILWPGLRQRSLFSNHLL
jgi:hypothetical protein